MLINSFVFCAYLEDLPVAGIQEHHSGVALGCSFWFPIVPSLPEFESNSRYRPGAMWPLQTGRLTFPIQLDSARWQLRSEMPSPCSGYQSVLPWCALLRILDFNPALFYLKVSALGEMELAWGRTGLYSESVPYQHRLFGIFTSHPFSRTKFYFKIAYKGIVC